MAFYLKPQLLFYIIFFTACATNTTVPLEQSLYRSFQFKYSVDIESTEGRKLEVWIPLPRSNEVQTISELSYDLVGPRNIKFTL